MGLLHSLFLCESWSVTEWMLLFECMQEKSGFFFCVEDRALLCRDCDLSIHSVNSLSSRHKRFLIPGIRVAWKALPVQEEPDAASEETPQFSLPTSKTSGMMNPVMSGRLSSTAQPPLSSSPVNHPMPQSKNQGGFVPKVGEVMGTSLSTGPQSGSGTLRKSSITEFLTEATSGWRVDELLNLADLAEGYNAANVGSSKVGFFDLWCSLSIAHAMIMFDLYLLNQECCPFSLKSLFTILLFVWFTSEHRCHVTCEWPFMGGVSHSCLENTECSNRCTYSLFAG